MCEVKLKIYYIGICLDSSCNASWRVLNDKNQVSCKFSPFWYINPHRWCLILPLEKKQTYKAGNSDFTVLNWQHDNEIMKCIFWKMHWCQKCPSFWNWLLSCAFKTKQSSYQLSAFKTILGPSSYSSNHYFIFSIENACLFTDRN